MPIYAFVAAGIASWFPPQDFTPAIRVTTPYVCAMNPPMRAGQSVIVENVDNGQSSHCIITGTGPCCGRVLDAGPRVRDELGFSGLTRVRVYRLVGHLPDCQRTPAAQRCSSPPRECVLALPKPALVRCR